MVKGFNSFRRWFSGYEEQYTIIGGTACDLLMTEEELEFRATKDIDLVLIVEALTAEFGNRFWQYIQRAGYEHRNKSTNEPQFYRFTKPRSTEYPAMIELFSRKVDVISLPEGAVLTPIPVDEEVSSLSAILLDENYYQFLREGRMTLDGVPVLKAEYLIPFKAKAWLDLTARKAAGEQVDSKNIRKHKNDVFRLTALLRADTKVNVSGTIYEDMQMFLEAISKETLDMKSLGMRGRSQKELIERIAGVYEKAER